MEADGIGFVERFLGEVREIAERLDREEVTRLAEKLVRLRDRDGRLFLLGVGGGAGHAAHAVGDFRKMVGIEAYTPVDNVPELTARTNDEGWETIFAAWLEGSRLRADDAVLVFSVGGGDLERGISANLVRALDYAKEVGATVLGVVGRDGGHTARVADACVLVPVVEPDRVTAHTESFQAVVWHLLVSHPELQTASMKWESVEGSAE